MVEHSFPNRSAAFFQNLQSMQTMFLGIPLVPLVEKSKEGQFSGKEVIRGTWAFIFTEAPSPSMLKKHSEHNLSESRSDDVADFSQNS